MNATPVSKTQRELVKLLANDHSLDDVAKLTAVPYANVRQIVSRANRKAVKTITVVPVSQTVTSVSERLQDELAENEKETRLSLSRYARRAAKDSEAATLRDAPLVHKAAQVAGIAHRWDSGDKPSHFTLNMLNINSLQVGEPEAQWVALHLGMVATLGAMGLANNNITVASTAHEVDLSRPRME